MHRTHHAVDPAQEFLKFPIVLLLGNLDPVVHQKEQITYVHVWSGQSVRPPIWAGPDWIIPFCNVWVVHIHVLHWTRQDSSFRLFLFLSGYQPCNAIQALENSPVPSPVWAASDSAQTGLKHDSSPGVELWFLP